MTKVMCDHCGKVLDHLNDYYDFELELINGFRSVDLCKDCMNKLEEKLDNLVDSFFGEGRYEKKEGD